MCSWTNLCITFNRQGLSCPAKNAIHFKTISTFGPKLFAVSPDTLEVFYHRDSLWHKYQSARNTRLGTMEDMMTFFNNDDDNNSNDDLSQEDNDGEDRDDDPGRQSNDSYSNNDSKYQINETVLYYCLIRIIVFLRLQFYIIQCQSLIR